MNNLQTIRLSLRMSREAFARRIGIYTDYIASLETSGRDLSPVWGDALAQGVGVSPDALADPIFDSVADPDAPLPPLRKFACPIALRFALQTLIAYIAGVDQTHRVSEDQYADAVVGLNAFLADSADDPVDEDEQFSRLLKGLQITALTVVRSCEIAPQSGFEKIMAGAVPPLARLIEDCSRSNVSDPETK